jgi:signal transduction histidine kinase
MPQTALNRQFQAVDAAADALRQSDVSPGSAAFQDKLATLLQAVDGLRSAYAKQSEALAELSEERYHTLFDSIDEGFCIIEVVFDAQNHAIDYIFIEVNPAFERQTGMVNAAGKRMRDFVPDHEEYWFEIYGEIALTGEPRRFENGSHALNRHFDLYAFRVGKPEDHHVAVLFTDVSERKALEKFRAELLEREQIARLEAERAVALQRIFLGMISHELRTPLASIKGFSSSLLAEDVGFDPAQQREFLAIIDQEADRLTELIDQLLDVVRMQAGTLQVMTAKTTLPSIVERALPQLETLTANHRLEVALPLDLPDIVTDNRRVAQVLVNLVGNAAKFSSPGTRIQLGATVQDSVVEVTVSDQGIGIPDEERSRVFEVFHQVRNHQPQQGAGLGLAICRGIVQAQGGTIWIDENASPGTTIRFTVPRAE